MKEDAQQRPKFKNLLEVIEKQARVMLDLVFGEIQCSADTKIIPKTNGRQLQNPTLEWPVGGAVLTQQSV